MLSEFPIFQMRTEIQRSGLSRVMQCVGGRARVHSQVSLSPVPFHDLHSQVAGQRREDALKKLPLEASLPGLSFLSWLGLLPLCQVPPTSSSPPDLLNSLG